MSKEVIVTKDLSKTYGKGDLQVHALTKNKYFYQTRRLHSD